MKRFSRATFARGQDNPPGAAGLTLIEVVVAMTILAIIALFVMPVVLQFFDTAQVARVARDLDNLRVAVQQFNVHTRTLPQYMTHLTGPIEAGADSSVYRTLYTDAQALRWNGPYLDRDLDPELRTTASTIWHTGFDGTIKNYMYCYNPAGNSLVLSCPGGSFVGVRVDGLSGAQFGLINDIMDGELESDTLVTDPTPTLPKSGAPVSWQTGRLRFVLSSGIDINSSIGVMYYYVHPINRRE